MLRRACYLALMRTASECTTLNAIDFRCHTTGMVEGSTMTIWGYDVSLMGKISACTTTTTTEAVMHHSGSAQNRGDVITIL